MKAKKVEAPYVGIRPFEKDDWPVFFGRESLSNELLYRLETNRFVAVVGSSGSGKSSVVKAGLLPLLQDHKVMRRAEEWITVICRPGDDPCGSLARRLVAADHRIKDNSDTKQMSVAADLMRAVLRTSDRGIIPVLEGFELPTTTHILIVVDQFEELFGFREAAVSDPKAPEEAERFVTCILDSCKEPIQPLSSNLPANLAQRIWVVLTMRSDFIGHCEIFPALSKKVSESQFLVPVLDPEQKRKAIIRPSLATEIEAANYSPFTFDDGLVSIIVNESGPRIDQLPLMQHALMRTWTIAARRAKEGTAETIRLTEKDYDSIGRINKALSEHADAAFAELTHDDRDGRKAAIARRLFLLLCDVSPEGKITRRRPTVDEVMKVAQASVNEVKTIVEAFQRDNRNFIVIRPTGEFTQNTRLDVSHEALLRQWGMLNSSEASALEAPVAPEVNANKARPNRLWRSLRKWLLIHTGQQRNSDMARAARGWLAEERDAATELLRLRQDCELHAQGRGDLLDNIDLARVAEWQERNRPSEDWAQRYLDGKGTWKCIEEFISDSRASVSLIRRLSWGLLALFVICLGWAAIYSSVKAKQAKANANAAIAAKTIALDLLRQASEQDYYAALRLIKEGDSNLALSYLARSIQYDPKNELARIALGQILLFNQNFPFKLAAAPLRHEKEVRSAAFSPDGRFVVTASDDGTAHLWEAATGKPIGEPMRHEDLVWSAAFSPDGRFVVTASYDGTARVWEAATGKPIGEPMRHEDRVWSAAFSPDGRFVVTASYDGTARVWEAATGKAIGEPLRHEDRVWSAAFSPDGRFVVTASYDGTARVWEAATGKAIGEPLRHEKKVRSAAFSPDGRFVVTASYDGTARVWEAATGKPIGEPLRHGKQVMSAAFSLDGRLVVTASYDGTAHLWEAATGKAIGEPMRHEKGIWSAAFSPDGRLVVTASYDGTAHLWEAATGKPIGEPMRHEDRVWSAAFSPDGRFVVTASSDATARVWEAVTGKPIDEPLRHEKEVNSAAFSPDGRFVVTAGSDWTARVWEAATGKAIGEPLRHKQAVWSAAFSPDGRFVVTASSDATARVWEAATGKPIGEPLRHEQAVWSAAFSPDGRFVVTAGSDGTARVWEAATGKLIGAPLRHEQAVLSAAFSPDGRFVVTAGSDWTARVWEAATGKLIGAPLRHEQAVLSAAFSPDGRFVVTAGSDWTARVWEAATGKAIGEPLRHKHVVRSAAFSPDGRFVVTASSDATARVWEAATGKAIGEPLRHKKEVNSAAFSPDGRFVVTASSDATARVWEAATGKAIGEPLRHEKEVNSAAFSPDGRFVVTASEDGTARVWPWFKPLGDSPENLIASIEQITFRKIAQDGGPAWIPPETVLSGSQLIESFGWFAEPTRTRTIWPGAMQTVPEYIVREIQDARRFREDRERAKSILDNAYPIDPAHPLIHLALAMLEDNKPTAAFLRDYDLKRLPGSCYYTKDLDPKEVLKLAAEMCAEQGDQERLQMVRDKLVAAYRSSLEVYTKADQPLNWAGIQNNLGEALYELGTRSDGEEGRKLLEDAVAAYRSSLEVYTKADQPQDWASTQTNLGNALVTLGDQLKGEEGLKRQRESVELLREVVSYQPDDQSRYRLASALGANLAFNLVLNSQFAEARTRCEEAQRLASEIGDGVQKSERDNLILLIQGNLAHAFLFQGHYDEALAIYRQYWDKPLLGKTFGEITLEDFAAFDKAGLTHPDLSRMKEALGNLPFRTSQPMK